MKLKKQYFKILGLIILLLISGTIILLVTLNLSDYWGRFSIYTPSHLSSRIVLTDSFSFSDSPHTATHIFTPSLDPTNSLLKVKFAVAGHPLLPINNGKYLTLPEYLKEANLITDNNIIVIHSLEVIKNLVIYKSYGAILPIEHMSPPLKIINLIDIHYFLSDQTTSRWTKINIEKFMKNITILNDNQDQTLTSIAFVGDIMLSRRVGLSIKKKGLEYPFENIWEDLNKYDLVFGNLESIISDQGYKANQPITFRASPDTVHILKKSRFSIVSLANNHALDFGSKALLDCLRLLKENNIKTSGAGKNIEEASKPTILEINGIKIGFIAYNSIPPIGLKATDNSPGVNYLNPQTIAKEVSTAREMVDLLIISLHWGIEYQQTQSKEQKEIAEKIFNNGANLIIGHHPHVLQPIYIFNQSKIVAYSLGNFIFDQDFSEETSIGGVLSVYLYGKKIVGLEFKPSYIIQDQLHWITDQVKIEKINRILKFQPLENINTP